MYSTFINVDNVSFKYSKNDDYVLKNLNISIEKGEYVSILGRNGCGKSTFVKLLNSLLIPTHGKIAILSMDTFNEKNLWHIRSKVSLLFQNPENQIVSSIVEEEVAFGPENLEIKADEIEKRVSKALQAVNMEDMRYEEVQHLSGGQKQRLAIASLLAMNPECLILDEGTSMLDPIGQQEVLNILQQLNSINGITIIHITHNMEEAMLSSRVLVLDDGEIVLDDTPENIFKNVQFLNNIRLETPIISSLISNISNQLEVELPTSYVSPKNAAKQVCDTLFK